MSLEQNAKSELEYKISKEFSQELGYIINDTNYQNDRNIPLEQRVSFAIEYLIQEMNKKHNIGIKKIDIEIDIEVKVQIEIFDAIPLDYAITNISIFIMQCIMLFKMKEMLIIGLIFEYGKYPLFRIAERLDTNRNSSYNFKEISENNDKPIFEYPNSRNI